MKETWFVTGSSVGLGRSIAEAALAEGHDVVASARCAGGTDCKERYHEIDPCRTSCSGHGIDRGAAHQPLIQGHAGQHRRRDQHRLSRTFIGLAMYVLSSFQGLKPMSTLSFWTSRRRLLGAAATAGLVGLMPAALRAAPAGDAIRPFRVNVPHADLDDLRRRVLATRWPANETVADQSQGVQLAKLQRLVRYWGTDYDWRKGEAKLNACQCL